MIRNGHTYERNTCETRTARKLFVMPEIQACSGVIDKRWWIRNKFLSGIKIISFRSHRDRNRGENEGCVNNAWPSFQSGCEFCRVSTRVWWDSCSYIQQQPCWRCSKVFRDSRRDIKKLAVGNAANVTAKLLSALPRKLYLLRRSFPLSPWSLRFLNNSSLLPRANEYVHVLEGKCVSFGIFL